MAVIRASRPKPVQKLAVTSQGYIRRPIDNRNKDGVAVPLPHRTKEIFRLDRLTSSSCFILIEHLGLKIVSYML